MPHERRESSNNPVQCYRKRGVPSDEAGSATMSASIRATSYNILANSYATRRVYPTVPPEILSWKSRGPGIVARIREIDPDVLCLQEVEAGHWADMHASLMQLGWDGIFAKKEKSRVDGCALLYRTGSSSLIESEALYFSDGDEPSGHVALIGVLNTRIGPVRFVTTHLRWQAETAEFRSHIGHRQAAELLCRLSVAGGAAATVICGDFNVRPEHPLTTLFSEHGFSDAYAAAPQSTCAPHGNAARIDYIFVSQGLQAEGERLPEVRDTAVMPNTDEPSDHLPITARIALGARPS